ncbi:Pyruvate dehydrogenase complex repressor [Cognatishimia activa]|uniref:Pyruvate dehydrogenase complex repressor n=1 Tax=Cognatishimia activa TaxID=1715691 RepID=A0A0P1IV75_9RHOB|nr:FadR/GntR family transcriptional regulator [Cognatishimia activa]CUK27470.1 Pyruvate dehydrogenase complex repressor [Cognatishimia activa]
MRRKNAPRLIFDKVESESVSDIAVAQIEELILSGVLREGDMLPGERELSDQLGISRPKVREALHRLAELDLVQIKSNDGVYVAKLIGDVMSPALVDLYNRSASAIRDNLEYRREQEGFASRLAAQRATPRDCEELETILAGMKEAEENNDRARSSELDLQLHQVIAFAAHNHTLNHMMTALYDLNRSSLFYNRDELSRLKDTSGDLLRQHEDIVVAICRGKPEQAEKAAHAHIDYVRELLEADFDHYLRDKLSTKRYSRVQS